MIITIHRFQNLQITDHRDLNLCLTHHRKYPCHKPQSEKITDFKKASHTSQKRVHRPNPSPPPLTLKGHSGIMYQSLISDVLAVLGMCRGFNFPPKHCHIIVPVICTHCPPPTYGEGWGIAPEEAWIQMTGALNMNVTGVTAKLICTFVFDILHMQNVGFLMMRLTLMLSVMQIV